MLREILLIIILFAVGLNVYHRLFSNSQQAPGQPYHHQSNGQFRNPEGSHAHKVSFITFWKFLWRHLIAKQNPIIIPENHVMPEAQALAELKSQSGNSITWIGHACFLIRLNGKTILTDPFLTELAGFWSIGPRRYIRPGISLENLPPIDFIVLSHNHYDSLDLETLKKLPGKEHTTIITPLKTGLYFKEAGYKNIVELDWEQSVTHEDIQFTALPAIHFSRRGLFDRDRTLWAGFAIKSDQQNIYFAGDSAYGNIFKNINAKYGPYDLAIIGIGAYEPQEIMQNAHTTPEQAVKIGKDLNAKNILGMHWGTVVLSDEPPFEAPDRFRAAAQKAGYALGNVWILKIGESKALSK